MQHTHHEQRSHDADGTEEVDESAHTGTIGVQGTCAERYGS
jgi:hypothetical protein